jgi:hypothetical protein
MNHAFEVVSGSITGRDHVHALRNNQDALAVVETPEHIVAVVCDGCSSGRFSEVGAHLGARLIAQEILRNLPDYSAVGIVDRVELARQNVLNQLRVLVDAMGESRSKTVNDYFLFTVVALIIDPDVTLVMSIGDGVFAVNGEFCSIGPFANNAPPYLAYELTGSTLTDQNPDLLRFTYTCFIPTEALSSVMIGTDGVRELADASDRSLPGKSESVGPISQFWQEDRFFKNPFTLGRRLNLINPTQPQVRIVDGALQRHEGLLPDDTTMVVVRRRKGV